MSTTRLGIAGSPQSNLVAAVTFRAAWAVGSNRRVLGVGIYCWLLLMMLMQNV